MFRLKADQFARLFTTFMLLVAGLGHFAGIEQLAKAVPPSFSNPELLVVLTGILELLFIPFLWWQKTRRVAAYAIALYIIALIPVHIETIVRPTGLFGIESKGFFIARLFLQPLLIYVAWRSRHTARKGVISGLDHLDKKLAERWSKPKAWQSHFLFWAAFYNIGFGFWAVVFPDQAFQLFGMETPAYPFLWQCIGMIVGVYGIGYLIAAADEMKHWPIVLVGLLGKILGPLGFVQAGLAGDLPIDFGIILIFNDLIWWPAFFAIMYRVGKAKQLF